MRTMLLLEALKRIGINNIDKKILMLIKLLIYDIMNIDEEKLIK